MTPFRDRLGRGFGAFEFAFYAFVVFVMIILAIGLVKWEQNLEGNKSAKADPLPEVTKKYEQALKEEENPDQPQTATEPFAPSAAPAYNPPAYTPPAYSPPPMSTPVPAPTYVYRPTPVYRPQNTPVPGQPIVAQAVGAL